MLLLNNGSLDKFFEMFDDNFDNFVGRFRMLGEHKFNDDGSLTLTIDVPGIDQKDLSVEVLKGVLTIKGERKTETSTSSFNRAVSLPSFIENEPHSAELKNGVLTLVFASKAPSSKEAKKIEIKSH